MFNARRQRKKFRPKVSATTASISVAKMKAAGFDATRA
jgi:hypothetical protein